MIVPRPMIFREKALKHYAQGKKKDVLPNFSSIPVAIFLWVLLVLLVATVLLACYGQVPVFLAGPAFSVGTGNPASLSKQVVGLFPANTATQLHAGQSIQISIGNQQLTGTVTQVTATNSPVTVLAHYGLQTNNTTVTGQKAVIVLVTLADNVSVASYQGTALALQVKVATISLFTALTGIGKSTGV